MLELLADIANNAQMYVRTYSRWGTTATCLRERGLAATHWCEGSVTRVVITQEGRDEAARRDLIKERKAKEQQDA